MKILHKENFYNTVFEENFLSEIYNEIWFNKTLVKIKTQSIVKAKVYTFHLFPNYFETKLDSHYYLYKIKQKPGFAVEIKNYHSIDDYLANSKKSFRKVIIRSVKRLEACFDIKYKMLFGEIDIKTYNTLMAALHEMLSNRFQQREGRNRVLENWDAYLNFAFTNINNKKASLFVIYNHEEPIAISLNFHCDTIMNSAISSYNIDYGKFSLGNIEIYKQLEWCCNNNIDFFDMGYGDFEYKRRWSNYSYDFETHIIALKNNVFNKFYNYFFKYKIRLTNYLIEKNIHEIYYKILGVFKAKKEEIETLEYQSIDLEFEPSNSIEIVCNKKQYAFLKKPLYDFLYMYTEHLKDVKVFSISNEANSYVFKGKKSLLKIII